ncbi:MICOS complex subunit MIC13-like [Styela clava]
MTTSRLVPTIRLGLKVGLIGGAVYLSTASGIWSKDTTQNVAALKGFTESVDQKLGGQYLAKIGLPTTDSFLRSWNNGVSYSINAAAQLPGTVTKQASNLRKYFMNDEK